MLLSPGGKEQYHQGSVCCKHWDGRPENVTSRIGSLGMSLWQNMGSCRGLGSKVVISKHRIRGRNWDWWSENEAMSKPVF